MKNVLTFNDALLVETKIAESLLQLKPMTSQGLVAKTKALQSIRESAINATFILALVNEFAKHPHDIALKGFVDSVSEAVNKRKNAFRLALVFEKNMSSNDLVQKRIVESIEEVICESERDIAVSIMDGKLKDFKTYCTELRIIEAEAIQENIANESNIVTNELEISHPVSYVEVVESTKTAYVRVGNRVFAINENSIVDSNTPSESFTYLSEAGKKFASNIDENNRIEISTATGVLVLEGTSISKVDEHGKLQAVDKAELIAEFARKAHNRQISEAELQKIDDVIAVSENGDNFKVLDNFTLIKNKITNESALVALHGNAVYFGILESKRNFASFKPTNGISEAVNLVQSTIGIDVSKIFEAQLKTESDAIALNKEQIQKIDEDIVALQKRKTQVSESIISTTAGSAANESFIKIEIEISEAIIALEKDRKKLIEG